VSYFVLARIVSNGEKGRCQLLMKGFERIQWNKKFPEKMYINIFPPTFSSKRGFENCDKLHSNIIPATKSGKQKKYKSGFPDGIFSDQKSRFG
jgi:hypothetical protein